MQALDTLTWLTAVAYILQTSGHIHGFFRAFVHKLPPCGLSSQSSVFSTNQTLPSADHPVQLHVHLINWWTWGPRMGHSCQAPQPSDRRVIRASICGQTYALFNARLLDRSVILSVFSTAAVDALRLSYKAAEIHEGFTTTLA